MNENQDEKGRFKPGNQAWKARAKHGRDAIFTDPHTMLETAQDFFQWCDDNPFQKSEAKTVSDGQGRGSSVEIFEIPVKRPYTMRGLTLYIGVTYDYFNDFKTRMKKAEGETAAEFVRVIKMIEEAIYDNKFTGAAAGFFKENLIARDLGLKEKTDVTTGGEKLPPSVDLKHLTLEQLKALAKDSGDQGSDIEGSQG